MNELKYGPPREHIDSDDDQADAIAFGRLMSPLLSESLTDRGGFYWLHGSDLLARHDRGERL